jgi:glycerophosphoryl diester phosphodiesterase
MRRKAPVANSQPKLSTINSPLIIAHRGASHDAPENTLAAFRLAWEQGADAIETDLRLTADGEIVAFHDADGHRIFGDSRRICDLTRTELRALAPAVPTLAEVLATVPAEMALVLELKESLGPALAAALADVAPDRVTLIAFDADVIAAAKRELPACRALWLFGERFHAKSAVRVGRDLALRVRELGVDGIDIRYTRRLSARQLAPLREDGRKLFTYTVDRPRQILDCVHLGFDGITTNRPAAARQWLHEAGLLAWSHPGPP